MNPVVQRRGPVLVSWCKDPITFKPWCEPCQIFWPVYSDMQTLVETFTQEVSYTYEAGIDGSGGIIVGSGTEVVPTGEHVQYNLGKKRVSQIAIPIVYWMSLRINSGTPGFSYNDPDTITQGILGVGEGQWATSQEDHSYGGTTTGWVPVSTFRLEYLGQTIYETTLTQLRIWNGGVPGSWIDTTDGINMVDPPPSDLIRITNEYDYGALNYITLPENENEGVPKVDPKDLVANQIYNTKPEFGASLISFQLLGDKTGKPDPYGWYMSGFRYTGEIDQTQDAVFDLWIRSLDPIGIGPGYPPVLTGFGNRGANLAGESERAFPGSTLWYAPYTGPKGTPAPPPTTPHVARIAKKLERPQGGLQRGQRPSQAPTGVRWLRPQQVPILPKVRMPPGT